MSPRTKEQNELIREQRIRQIVRAAANVYLEKGVMLEMKDVAAHAGLGYGTVYHYYNNKFLLLDRMLNDAMMDAKSLLASALPGRVASVDSLHAYVVELLKLWSQNLSVFILYKLAAENGSPLPSERYESMLADFQNSLYAPVASAIESLMRAGSLHATDPEATANLLMGSLIGCAGLYLYHGQSAFDAERIAAMAFNGILKREDFTR